MQTFGQRMFFAFGLRRNTATRRTPEVLQVERSQGNNKVVPIRADHRGRQRPAPFSIGIEVRDGFQFIKPLARQPRTA